ncbi:hypothetical protein [Actinoplanes sp. TFC3]|uniref:hypothetical protein n=1 Tax=Actinoplanes sp. TFC3 TaxID=1710355 RepID=UPI00082B3585|nr:hypothetical protein [Actinoplanes sp. TFC3]
MQARDGKSGEQVHDHPDEEPEEVTVTPDPPVMPAPPFPAFQSVPTLPQQTPGVGFESGRDSRAR